ncbi:MAG: Gfo/Idh/MocA family oxidoreductase [Bacteroidales bacterium]|nr:Gfo/Idh/MocA family oxidoreductase [Bacteroidales bacterium]
MNSQHTKPILDFLKWKIILTNFIMLMISFSLKAQAIDESFGNKPLHLGIIGLSHDHVHAVFQNRTNPDIVIVGIAESDTALVTRYVNQYNLDRKIIFSSTEELISKTKPEAVSVFTPISEHIKIVRICAPLKIHVMVEKPLAINFQQAKEMNDLSKKWGIEIITNYETTWYPVTKDAYTKTIEDKLIGEPRKMVIHDGHKGPIEIGCSTEFTNWLTDPVLNGGGAIIDFGCYGTDLISYFMNGERPTSVTAITQQIKPDIYPKVDDEATIIVTYPKMQGIIQASWNWPVSRKDMEIYGKTGYIITSDNVHMKVRTNEQTTEQMLTIDKDKAIAQNPFSFFASVVRGKIKLASNDPSSLSLNLVAMEILDAAVQSARSGKTIFLK